MSVLIETELFPATGSVVELVTEGLFVIVEGVPGVVTTIVTVALEPKLTVPMVQVTVPAACAQDP